MAAKLRHAQLPRTTAWSTAGEGRSPAQAEGVNFSAKAKALFAEGFAKWVDRFSKGPCKTNKRDAQQQMSGKCK
jgi:hypothetical protein